VDTAASGSVHLTEQTIAVATMRSSTSSLATWPLVCHLIQNDWRDLLQY